MTTALTVADIEGVAVALGYRTGRGFVLAVTGTTSVPDAERIAAAIRHAAGPAVVERGRRRPT